MILVHGDIQCRSDCAINEKKKKDNIKIILFKIASRTQKKLQAYKLGR